MSNIQKDRNKTSRKKTYRKPRLTRFGSIAEMTRARTNQGTKDGGHGFRHAS